MSTTVITTPPASTLERRAAAGSAAAAVTFAVLLATLHVVRPDLDPSWRFLSEYALSRAGGLMTAAFVALATGLLAATGAVARQVRTWPGRVGLALLAIAAVGLLLAAAFPTDPITAPPAAQTAAGRLHQLGASLDWSPVGMLLIAWSLGRTAAGRSWRRRLVLAAAVPCLLTLAFTAVAVAAGGQFGPGVYAGAIGRLLLLSYLGWLIPVARLVRVRPAARTGTAPAGEPALV